MSESEKTEHTIIINDFLKKDFSIDEDVDDIDIWMQATRSKVLSLKGKKPSDAYMALVGLVNGDMKSFMEKVMRLMNKVAEAERKKS